MPPYFTIAESTAAGRGAHTSWGGTLVEGGQQSFAQESIAGPWLFCVPELDGTLVFSKEFSESSNAPTNAAAGIYVFRGTLADVLASRRSDWSVVFDATAALATELDSAGQPYDSTADHWHLFHLDEHWIAWSYSQPGSGGVPQGRGVGVARFSWASGGLATSAANLSWFKSPYATGKTDDIQFVTNDLCIHATPSGVAVVLKREISATAPDEVGQGVILCDSALSSVTETDFGLLAGAEAPTIADPATPAPLGNGGCAWYDPTATHSPYFYLFPQTLDGTVASRLYCLRAETLGRGTITATTPRKLPAPRPASAYNASQGSRAELPAGLHAIAYMHRDIAGLANPAIRLAIVRLRAAAFGGNDVLLDIPLMVSPGGLKPVTGARPHVAFVPNTEGGSSGTLIVCYDSSEGLNSGPPALWTAEIDVDTIDDALSAWSPLSASSLAAEADDPDDGPDVGEEDDPEPHWTDLLPGNAPGG